MMPGVTTDSAFEVTQPPHDSVSALSFSPATLPHNFLVAGSWDNSVRCWQVEPSGNTVLKAMQSTSMPILDVCWSDDGTKVFTASCNKQVSCWDLESGQAVQVAAHDAPVKTCHWIKAPSYTCLMTGSLDKTLKFWDTRSPNPIKNINLQGKVFCADIDYPMVVVVTALKCICLYTLDGKPELIRSMEAPMKLQNRCVAIFRDRKRQIPIGFALGSDKGYVAIQFADSQNVNNCFNLVCHRKIHTSPVEVHDIYAVNDLKFHPIHNTLATVGSDATYMFWDLNRRSVMKSSDTFDQQITKCCFNYNGQIFAYSIGYDWSKGHEYHNPAKKPQIFLKPCFDELKPKNAS